ncbi:MAG: putative O-antigen transporter [Candidatus Izimaplasma bacterium HR2]|nr:MAG: putative O-antigen transporter [Candidatus Izimaplasma bacterium HR2]
MKSIKKNLFYNTLLRMLNVIVPLITFPYVARVLTPVGIGKFDFSFAIVQYFILIAQVGIPIYAVRQCAKYSDDKDRLSRTVQEILLINVVMMFISYIGFIILIFAIKELFEYRILLLIIGFNIFSTSIGIEWFYQAIEKFKYIAIRSFIVKIITIVLIFTLVKSSDDLIVYAILIIVSVSLGYIYNFIYMNKHINIFKKYDNFSLKRHFKPIIYLFALTISVSIYTNLDKVMLGVISGNIYVGYYGAANKIVKIILAIVTSLGAVLLPRMSNYIEKQEYAKINELIKKSLMFILLISIPASIGLFLLANPIIIIFAGSEYIEAIKTIKIMSPVIIIIALSNIIGIQILVAHGKEKLTMASTMLGAAVNMILNFILIPVYYQNGAAIATIVAELSITIIQIVFAYKYIKGNFKFAYIYNYLFGGGLIILTTLVVRFFIDELIFQSFLTIFLSIFVYFGFLFLIKDSLVTEFLKRIHQYLINLFYNRGGT